MELKEHKIMGKASRWLCSIFCRKRADSHHQPSSKPPHKDRRRWSFLKPHHENHSSSAKNSSSVKSSSSSVKLKAAALTAQANHLQQQKGSSVELVDPEKQTIASAVKAASLTAQAAAKVVKLTSSSGSCAPKPAYNFSRSPTLQDIAAVIIQSVYRGHLARRALQALKGVVKFQAVVRGHIERKRAAEWLRRMEILVRAQIRARDEITCSSQSSSNPSHLYCPVSRNGSRLDRNRRTLDINQKLYLGRKLHSTTTAPIPIHDGKKNKIVDSWEPHFTIKGRNPFHSSYLPLHSYLCNNCSFTNPRDAHQTHPNNR